ncbi:MAG: hypothetical protein FJ087_06150 [Deltaproteobacteria bacterium]|nr:hypothetical protein [Deltaproteobacteria bacterium]
MRIRTLVGAALAAALVVAVPASAEPKDVTKWPYAATRGGKVLGRLDVAFAKRDGQVYLVTGFYPGQAAVKDRKGGKPATRSYAELDPEGMLGKYKRWEVKGKGYLYWMAFLFDGKVKVRHERGVGDKGKVKDVGEAGKVRPLDHGQPQLAWLLTGAGKPAEIDCVGVNPGAFGKARVEKGGEEPVELTGGGKASLQRWEVGGDCGEYLVWTDGKGEPVVMETGGVRYERLR